MLQLLWLLSAVVVNDCCFLPLLSLVARITQFEVCWCCDWDVVVVFVVVVIVVVVVVAVVFGFLR